MAATEMDDIAGLVKQYAAAAAAHGRATETGDHSGANAAHNILSTIYNKLRDRGRDAQLALLPLLEDPDPGVRAWAGAHALEFAPIEGERTLLQISKMARSLVSFGAEMTLRQWREGKLRFP